VKLRNELKTIRQRRDIAQGVLAKRASVSRQTLSNLENGSSEPSMGVALRLAQALGCRVDELFGLHEEGSLTAGLSEGQAVERGTRVALGKIDGRWVAHPLERTDPASFALRGDGLVVSARGAKAVVRTLTERSSLEQNVILCGCDPALGILASRAFREGHRFVWIPSPSEQALAAMAHSTAHIAGLHLFDQDTGVYNTPFVRRASAGRPMLVMTLAHVVSGLVVARRNPHKITSVADLTRSRLQIVNREKGAGARQLLDRLLRREGIKSSDVRGYQHIGHGHFQVAQMVASGAADAAIATESAAIAHGLSFIPIAEERFDLALTLEMAKDPRIICALETLHSLAFRRELQSLGGYDLSRSGNVVTEMNAA